MKNDKSILLFTKQDSWSDTVVEYLTNNFEEVDVYRGNWGDPFPTPLHYDIRSSNLKSKDYVISYLCPWKLPKEILDCAQERAINFHPGPPKYPGIGCYNYAIWNEDDSYGVIVHEMDEKLDHGEILDFREFNINQNETIYTLKNKAQIKLLNLFYDIISLIKKGVLRLLSDPPEWADIYYSREDFQDLCDCSKELNLYFKTNESHKIKRKLRATYYEGARDGPYFEIDGKKYRIILEDNIND